MLLLVIALVLHQQTLSFGLQEVLTHEETVWIFSPASLFNLAIFEEMLYNASNMNFAQTEFKEIYLWRIQYEASKEVSMVSNDLEDRFNKITSNLILSLNMLNRTVGLRKILAKFTNTELQNTEFYIIVNNYYKANGLPNLENVKLILKFIIWLQYTYEFPAYELLKGSFGKIRTGTKLNLQQGLEVALMARSLGLFPETLEWIQAIRISSSEEQTRSDTLLESALDLIKYAKEHDELFGNNFDWETTYKSEVRSFTGFYTNRYLGTIFSGKKLKSVKQAIFKKYAKTDPNLKYIKLCRGETIFEQSHSSILNCKFDTGYNYPNHILNPLKMEVHSFDPYIVQFYDVITEEMNDFLVSSSSNKQEQSAVLYQEDGKETTRQFVHPNRVSASSFIGNNFEVEMERKASLSVWTRIKNLVKNVSVIANLKVTSYTFGGYFTPHWDQYHQGGKAQGDRLGTFMIYLNELYGGYTVFPLLGISIVPKRNSAIFWYNYHSNGSLDTRTLHGGCPVIYGSKWITSVWVRSNKFNT